MRAHIGALVVEEFIVDRQDMSLFVDRGADAVALLARVIGGDQMLAPVLDPFHRPAKPQRGRANQHVLGIKLSTNSETSADMALVQMHTGRAASEHAGELVAVPVRHLGRAIHFQDVARGVIAADRAARFHRHPGMPPD